jgi:hypothetical protein
MKWNSSIAILLLAATGLMAQSAGTQTFFGDWMVSTNNPMPGMSLKARLLVSRGQRASSNTTEL